jgi:hypothetical protein
MQISSPAHAAALIRANQASSPSPAARSRAKGGSGVKIRRKATEFVDKLVLMGFDEESVTIALVATENNFDDALAQLLQAGNPG